MFLYLNHYCFNGIYRTNSKGKFNTPYGAKKKIKIKASYDDLLNCARAIRNVKFSSDDFEYFLDSISPQRAVIYLDPPYFTKDTRVFGEYSKNIFNLSDLARLRVVAEKLCGKKNKIVISYANCTEFKNYFSDCIVGKIKVQRNVGGFSGRRRIDSELIAVLGS